jgi:hypothetical protein
MSKMDAHDIYAIDENGHETQRLVAHVKPASRESVLTVLSASDDNMDGRSDWVWVRLASGDLVLGVFPQGDTYMATENDHC